MAETNYLKWIAEDTPTAWWHDSGDPRELEQGKANGAVGRYARVIEWNAQTGATWTQEVEGAAAVINLAGENIAARRWSRSRKADILQSRSHSIKAIIDAIETARTKPKVFIQASAIGYYGAHGDEPLDEDANAGRG